MATEQKMSLLGEQIIKESDQGVLVLTNYRVKFDAAATGSSKYTSIPLDAVASCGLITSSRPSLLVAAGIAGLIAFIQPESGMRYLLLLAAIVLVVAYFVTRSAVINVSSNGGESIVIPAKGMSRDQIVPFLEAVVEARLKLLAKLAHAAPARPPLATSETIAAIQHEAPEVLGRLHG